MTTLDEKLGLKRTAPQELDIEQAPVHKIGR
ncbi:hypothetical protein ABIB50_002042 [Mucilaginibacter sp. UYCu711]